MMSTGQRWLAVGVAAFGLVLTPIAFAVMYVTVTGLLRPSFGSLAWTVPVGTEAGFIGLFLADLLLEWIRKPLWWLPAVPYLLAAVSVALNALAGAGAPAGILGHEVLPVVFFGYLIAAKAIVRRFALTDESRQQEIALRDAKAHARDMLRSALGVGWRFRTPVLLRRQLRSGRLPAKVMEATTSGSATEWEDAVEAWIAAAVTLPERTAEALRAARAEPVRSTPADVPEAAAEASPETVPEHAPDTAEPAPRTHSQARPKRPSRPALKLTAARSRSMSPDKLAEHVEAMFAEYGEAAVSVNKIKADLSVGTDKAAKARAIAVAGRARVVPFGDRRQAQEA